MIKRYDFSLHLVAPFLYLFFVTAANGQGLPACSAESKTSPTQSPTSSGDSNYSKSEEVRSVMIAIGGSDESETPKQSTLKSDSRLAAALMNDDLIALKDLIDNKGVDIEKPLDQSGIKALQWAVEWYSNESTFLPVQEQILRFLLERCADKVQPLEWLKNRITTINEKLNKAISENYMIGVWQSKKEGNQKILGIVSNAPACTKKTSQNQEQSDGEQVSISDWVEPLMSNFKVILFRNNSKRRSVKITQVWLSDCENVAILCGLKGAGGSAGGGWIIGPGQTGSAVAVMKSDSTRPLTFQYQYWAEFLK